jgi:hypothetical protein
MVVHGHVVVMLHAHPLEEATVTAAARSLLQRTYNPARALRGEALARLTPSRDEQLAEMARGLFHLREAERAFGLAMPLRGGAYAAARCEALRDTLADYAEDK